MNKAYKFRIYPSRKQQELLAGTFGCVRFVYNRMLADTIRHYELTGQHLQPSPAQYKKEFPFLREVDSLALANAQLHLRTAFRGFFRNPGRTGFPRFKRKHDSRQSYTTNHVNGNIRLQDGYLKLPKTGLVKVKQHRQIPDHYRLKSVTVSLSPSGKYHASILFEYEEDIPAVPPVRVLGLDFSMSELFIASDGSRAGYPQFYRKSLERVAREQRKLSRCRRGGANWRKQKRKAALLHEKVRNQRKDFLHKQSRQTVNAWDAICIESLNMKGMAKALHFGKSVHDNGWGMFTAFLAYKLADQGKKLVKIDMWYPSSKTCSCCGAVKDQLLLSERIYRCECGFACDRDLNAAVNIKNQGMLLLV